MERMSQGRAKDESMLSKLLYLEVGERQLQQRGRHRPLRAHPQHAARRDLGVVVHKRLTVVGVGEVVALWVERVRVDVGLKGESCTDGSCEARICDTASDRKPHSASVKRAHRAEHITRRVDGGIEQRSARKNGPKHNHQKKQKK